MLTTWARAGEYAANGNDRQQIVTGRAGAASLGPVPARQLRMQKTNTRVHSPEETVMRPFWKSPLPCLAILLIACRSKSTATGAGPAESVVASAQPSGTASSTAIQPRSFPDRFAEERRNPSWATANESAIREILTQGSVGTVVSIECRTELCKVIFRYQSAKEQSKAPEDLSKTDLRKCDVAFDHKYASLTTAMYVAASTVLAKAAPATTPP